MTNQTQTQQGLLVAEHVVCEELCNQLLASFKAQNARPRSYQGAVDPTVRKCDYAHVPTDLAKQVDGLIAERIDSHFALTTRPIPDQPHLIYRYGEGVGFTTHHDEVTDVEQERARTNAQPVIGGDITAVVFLNPPDAYVGGALYFEQPVQAEVRPSRGSLVSFPAIREFLHGVRPIEAGERFTLLARRKATVDGDD